MSLVINENEKIIGVCFQNERWSCNNVYYYIVDKNFKIPEYNIILLQPHLNPDYNSGSIITQKEFELQWVYVVEVIENTILDKNTYIAEEVRKATRPFFYANVDLTKYIETVRTQKRKFELEKAMNQAAKSYEKVAKYRALAELDPGIKELFTEYMNIVNEDNKNLLNP